MSLLNLPHSTLVERNIPKNAFDSYANSKQKKLFTDRIAKITWKNKISPDTVNLKAEEIEEIQVFEIRLKAKETIDPLLQIINKAIPYHIIFWMVFEEWAYYSTSKKHPHPINENNAVIDWTFQTDWIHKDTRTFTFNLKTSVDAVYKDFCVQLTGDQRLRSKSLEDIIQYLEKVKSLKTEVARLESEISKNKQFNKRVELNIKLKTKEDELNEFLNQ